MTELNSLWEAIQNAFSKSKGEVTYHNLIAPAKPLKFSDGKLSILLPTHYHLDFWKSIADQVINIAYKETSQEITLDFSVIKDSQSLANPTITNDNAILPIPKEENTIHSEYTFKTFIEGQSNMMAYASALATSESPGDKYNPLLIYGGVGLGKTHLIQAIANSIKNTNPGIHIKYVTSENFINSFINAIKTKNSENFRRDYRNLDVLLVDDIQFFASKEETQTEFFNTFNALYNNQKQIVLTSDKDPRKITNLTKRLASRFMWGVAVEITLPTLETREAILRSKAKKTKLSVTDDALNYIAQQINSNVRELEGAFKKVSFFAEIHQQPITLNLAIQVLQGTVPSENTGVTISSIQKQVAAYYQIKKSDLIGIKRNKDVVLPRQVAMYLTRELTNHSLPKIGKEFGNRDHTTVLHAIDKIKKQVSQDIDIQNDILKLKNDLQF